MEFRVIMNWDFKGSSGDDVYKKAKQAPDRAKGTWTEVTSGLDGIGSYDDLLAGVIAVVDAIKSNPPSTGSLRHLNITVISNEPSVPTGHCAPAEEAISEKQ